MEGQQGEAAVALGSAAMASGEKGKRQGHWYVFENLTCRCLKQNVLEMTETETFAFDRFFPRLYLASGKL